MESRAYQNKGIAVFGLGKSGLSTAKHLHDGGARVVAWDDNQDRQQQAKDIGLTVKEITAGLMAECDFLLLSPGVPLTHPAPHPVVELAHAAGVQIIGDIEVFLKEKTAGKVIGITGTNGKSTTTSLIHHMLKHAGRDVAMGGNIGTPVLELPRLSENGFYVLELSSYQLDLTPSWHGDAAVLLNVTPDHLDRHGDMAGYAAVKKKIFQNQSSADIAVINHDNVVCAAIVNDLGGVDQAVLVEISTEQNLESGIFAKEETITDNSPGGNGAEFSLAGVEALRGKHNRENAAAAVAVCRAMGLTDIEIASGLLSFGGLSHRMEMVAIKNGVRYVNDSKATNADAAEKSLATYENIFWIAGGLGKAGGIKPLVPYFDRITHAFLIGKDATEFALTLEGHVPYTVCGTLDKAVEQARQQAVQSKNATVLLAPAAASFDQFPSFEARGDRFRQLVEEEAA
ncbi:UDP-N-acetylmuramoyl-L-alanine--D-glutamate ligase [Sneathiella sp. P13V-1]|uniref:UDP-N-acetylmuramoyl-L-alanine--D-glutamate ligase n=1 Tax=Sneathiella sp. P13V-1 TaxID=2697366 RepID=UPI00187BC269|nr:UDP-N-acetylmuramoyl-L-alanine--D-glutamate ligase [Sneathiella sp. P13V-1]MBE7636683.1 UDP-N-acetylmuramoyl-L-alanine--D-glutamate ligase [Sneathiella sp. P13V-1]